MELDSLLDVVRRLPLSHSDSFHILQFTQSGVFDFRSFLASLRNNNSTNTNNTSSSDVIDEIDELKRSSSYSSSLSSKPPSGQQVSKTSSIEEVGSDDAFIDGSLSTSLSHSAITSETPNSPASIPTLEPLPSSSQCCSAKATAAASALPTLSWSTLTSTSTTIGIESPRGLFSLPLSSDRMAFFWIGHSKEREDGEDSDDDGHTGEADSDVTLRNSLTLISAKPVTLIRVITIPKSKLYKFSNSLIESILSTSSQSIWSVIWFSIMLTCHKHYSQR